MINSRAALLRCSALCTAVLLGGADSGQERQGDVKLRGRAARFTISHEGQPLRAKAVNPSSAPILVSVRPGDTAHTWEVDMVGIAVGTHDLAQYLEHADGSRAELAPLEVAVVSALPPGLHTNLASSSAPQLKLERSRIWPAWAALAVWGVSLVVWLLLRAWRKLAEAAVPVLVRAARDPHQLLIEAVGARPMTVPERGRLELLTLRALTKLRGVAAGSETSIGMYKILRDDASSAPIVDALERWLHRPEQGHDEYAHELQRLLRAKFQSASSGSAQPEGGP